MCVGTGVCDVVLLCVGEGEETAGSVDADGELDEGGLAVVFTGDEEGEGVSKAKGEGDGVAVELEAS